MKLALLLLISFWFISFRPALVFPGASASSLEIGQKASLEFARTAHRQGVIQKTQLHPKVTFHFNTSILTSFSDLPDFHHLPDLVTRVISNFVSSGASINRFLAST